MKNDKYIQAIDGVLPDETAKQRMLKKVLDYNELCANNNEKESQNMIKSSRAESPHPTARVAGGAYSRIKLSSILTGTAVFAVVALGITAMFIASRNQQSGIGLSDIEDMPPVYEDTLAEDNTPPIEEEVINTIEDETEHGITAEDAKEIVFDLLLNIQDEIKNAGTFIPTEDSSYRFIADFIGDIEVHDNLPEFEMKLDTIEDIEFMSVEYTKGFARAEGLTIEVYDVEFNSWRVYAKTNTTWGEIDSIFNCLWIFSIDAITGKLDDMVWVGTHNNSAYHDIEQQESELASTGISQDVQNAVALAERLVRDMWEPYITLTPFEMPEYVEDNLLTHLAMRYPDYHLAEIEKYPGRQLISIDSLGITVREHPVITENDIFHGGNDTLSLRVMAEIRYTRVEPSVNGVNVLFDLVFDISGEQYKIVEIDMSGITRYTELKDEIYEITGDRGKTIEIIDEVVDAAIESLR